jgi:hypothetical protein
MDENWRPREFSSLEEVKKYGDDTMSEDLKQAGFKTVVVPISDGGLETMRINYRREN